MRAEKLESVFTEYIAEEDLLASSLRLHRRQPSINPAERGAILQNTVQSLQQLQMALEGHDMELHWASQLLIYVQRIQTANPPQSADEQFSQLYYLRKWLFWVPISLLRRQGGTGPALLTLSHFYATALNLEPLFPDLGSSFCGAMTLSPLETILRATTNETGSLMQFPRQTVLSYRSRALQTSSQSMMQQTHPLVNIGPETLSYISMGNISPAFAPSPLHYGTPQSASSTQSPFLEVPSTHAGFSYGTQSWGTAPSPSFPARYTGQDEQMYDYMAYGGFRGGFVAPAPIWT